MNIFDLPPDEFLAMLPELAQQGVDVADLRRRYRAHNSAAAPVHEAAAESARDMAARGRRPIAGGLFSKEEGTTGRNALASIQFEPRNALVNALSAGVNAVEAPAAAANGLIPQQDMALEALGTAGMAMTGGGAVSAPRGSIRSGLARNADSMTPSQQMAQRILDLRAAGRASEVTDDMMAQADPVYLFDNYPLAMDQASRMQRARDMGFDTDLPLYHGGRDNIKSVSLFEGDAEGGPGTFYATDERRVANSYAPSRPNPSGENVMPILARSEGYREAGYTRPFPDDGTPAEIDDWLRGVDNYNTRMSGDGVKSAVYSQQIDAARKNAQPGVVMRQTIDDRIDSRSALPSDVFITLDPTTLRSRFARFDPEFSHLANLNAANASLAGGAVAVNAEGQPVPVVQRNALNWWR